MRTVPWLLLVALVAGCNSLTGTDDLELVNGCVDCAPQADASTDTAKADTAPPVDTAIDSAAIDSGEPDTTTSPEDSGADAADASGADADADAADAGDAKPFCTNNKMCNDLDPCTTDTCQVLTGVCSNVLIDGDGDGEAPSTAGACGLDCYDGNKDVFSKQTTFFTTAYATAAGTSSFDYDCDGVETKQYTVLGKCTKIVAGSCSLTAGWNATSVPACGGKVNWISACTWNATVGTCVVSNTTRTQGCR